MWPYRFMECLPKDLNLGPAKQSTKESKRIQAEDAGSLAHWYDLLANLLKDVPARLVYNMDECGFRQGKLRKVISSKGKSCPDLAESSKGENITAVECISADGWQMDPMIIFTSQGAFMANWFHGSESLPLNTVVVVSATG
jgi:hypothetical protein